MRMLCLLVFSGLFFTAGYAQTIQYGAEGGINLSGARATGQDGVVFHGTPGVRFSLGGFADIGLKDSIFSIQPKLFFSREAYTPNIFGDKTPFAISFLTLPIPVVYHSSLANKKLSFGLGPYLCYVISGKYTYDGHTTKLALGNNSTVDDGKHFDAGLDAMVGYQLQDNLSLRARLDWGLTQDSADPSFDKVWTRNFSITCAYTLGQK
jgi:Outer membrane protein beta-barrel domain